MMTDEQNTRQLRPAKLGNFDGHGILTVMRGAEGQIIDTLGTWRYEREIDPTAFKGLEIGKDVIYEGPIADGEAEDPKVEEAKLNVVITDITEYDYLDGQSRTLVTFTNRDKKHQVVP